MSNFLKMKTDTEIPSFLSNGILPPGIHPTSWEEFVKRYGVNHKRKIQLNGLHKALEQFEQAGCTCIYIDGSFVTNKKNPGDFDALYELDEVNDQNIDSILLDSTLIGRDKQKKYYEGEFFPAYTKAAPDGTIYLNYFQKDKKTGDPKGIIKINLR
jgi:hypothetical protein